MRVMTIALPLLAVAGCASLENSPAWMQLQAREATRLNDALAGFNPGKPVSCLPNRDIRGPEAYGETTLLFRVNRKLIYRTETRGTCRGIAQGDALITKQFSSQLCAGDIAYSTDLRTGFQSGTCALGEFIPYTRK